MDNDIILRDIMNARGIFSEKQLREKRVKEEKHIKELKNAKKFIDTVDLTSMIIKMGRERIDAIWQCTLKEADSATDRNNVWRIYDRGSRESDEIREKYNIHNKAFISTLRNEMYQEYVQAKERCK